MAQTSKQKPPLPGSLVRSIASSSAALQAQNAERSRLLDEYFECTKVLQVLQDYVTGLAAVFKTQLRLPANVYPELLETIRVQELRRALELHDDSHASLDVALQSDESASTAAEFLVYGVEENEKLALPVWGCKSTLERLSAVNLHSLLELLDAAFSTLVSSKGFEDDDCCASVHAALVGHCVFGAKPPALQPSFLELESHVFVLGQQLEKAMAVFARFLIKQLHEAASAAAASTKLTPGQGATDEFYHCVACDGIAITTSSSATGMANEDVRVWTLERVLENRVAFVNAVKTALVGHAELALTRYYCVKRAAGEPQVLQVVQTFFFHFTASTADASNGSTKESFPLNKAQTTPNTAASRSFLTGSRVLASGLCFHVDGALMIATRFREEARAVAEEAERQKKPSKHKKQQLAVASRDNNSSEPPRLASARSRWGFPTVMQDAMDRLRAASSSSTCLLHTNQLLNCFAYRLANLLEAHHVVKRVLGRWDGSDAVLAMIRTSIEALQVRLGRFLDESLASPPSSVMHPVHTLLRHFHARMNAVAELANDQEIDDFLEALERTDELCFIVVQIIIDDVMHLVETESRPEPTSAATQPRRSKIRTDASELAEIDVSRALEMAIHDRKYPCVLLPEAIFAQALVDSCLDIALESAVMNTVAVCLPPNPFVELSSHLQVFALRQLVWKQALTRVPPKIIEEIVRPDTHPLFAVEGQRVYAPNAALLELMDADQVAETQRWLVNHDVLHSGSYVPPKSSYSASIFPSLLAFRPLALARPVLKEAGASIPFEELDCIEHYVLEGSEFLQARSFFADAVRGDLRRIASKCGKCSASSGNSCWQFPAEASVLDRHGQVVASIDLSPSTTDELLAQIIEEAVQVQCLVQISVYHAGPRIQSPNSVLVIHRVTKAYGFHHKSTESGENPRCLSPLASRWLVQYGVFFSMENALFCLQHLHEDVVKGSTKACQDSTSSLPQDQQTPYGPQAHQHGDLLLLYELRVGSQRSSPQDPGVYEIARRLVLHSKLLHLFSLEQAIEWCVGSLQTTQHQYGHASSASRVKRVGLLAPATVCSLQQRFVVQIVAQMEQLVVPLNCELRFLPPLASHLATLQQRVAAWQVTLPLSDEQLELRQSTTPSGFTAMPDTPREDPATAVAELIASFRATRTQLLFFRFFYQRAFFANDPQRATDPDKQATGDDVPAGGHGEQQFEGVLLGERDP